MKHTASTFAILAIFFGFFAGLGEPIQAREPGAGADTDTFAVTLDDPRIRQIRLEIFAANGTRLYDSGPTPGAHLQIDESTALAENGGEPASFELRAWDGSGNLLYSGLSFLDSGTDSGSGSEIFSVDFERIPAGTQFGGAVRLDSDVNITGSLDVAGAVHTPELRKVDGTSFFQGCNSGYSIRTISAAGEVVCERDDTGGGGDHLGNHTAQQNLQMSSHSILFDNGAGLRADGGAEIKTGPFGGTFQFSSGPSSIYHIAHFNNHQGDFRLAINNDGGILFTGGQKLCRTFDALGSQTLMVSAGWTAGTCSSFRSATQSGGHYQLGCLFDTSYSFGTANGGVPSQNCGW